MKLFYLFGKKNRRADLSEVFEDMEQGENTNIKKQKQQNKLNYYPMLLEEELRSVEDWSEFASACKNSCVMPNSYLVQPKRVIVSTISGRPILKLRFDSATSSSYRWYIINGLDVACSVNGSANYKTSEALNRVWLNEARKIRQRYDLKMSGNKQVEDAWEEKKRSSLVLVEEMEG